ncbi:MAG: hypothetical protein Q8N15_01270 [Bacillota bacterium]|nr:hypothetical protein [Bacillota bacterium]
MYKEMAENKRKTEEYHHLTRSQPQRMTFFHFPSHPMGAILIFSDLRV